MSCTVIELFTNAVLSWFEIINFDILFIHLILDGSTLLMKAEMFKTEIASQQLL